MKRWNLSRLCLHLGIGIAAWAAVATLCLCIGSTGIHWPIGEEMTIRGEAVLLASLVGASLAGAGAAYQAVLRNPLADPYLLGASSGAALAAYVWRLPALTGIASDAGQQAFAFAGALAAVGTVLILTTARSGRRRLDPVTLLLVGVIVNAVCGAIYLLLNAIHKDSPGAGGEMGFLVGGIGHVPHAQFVCAAVTALVGWIALMLMSGSLSVATLGEGEAESLGVRIHRLRWIALCAASLMTAAAVAVSGPIAFVGLVCPHAARPIVGGDQRRLLPAATAAGAILLALADAASRGLAAQNLIGTQLQVGILTGLLGGPFFLTMLLV